MHMYNSQPHYLILSNLPICMWKKMDENSAKKNPTPAEFRRCSFYRRGASSSDKNISEKFQLHHHTIVYFSWGK